MIYCQLGNWIAFVNYNKCIIGIIFINIKYNNAIVGITLMIYMNMAGYI